MMVRTARIHRSWLIEQGSVQFSELTPADNGHRALAGLVDGQPPSFSLLQSACVDRDWPIETWAADLPLTCQVGQ
jgi:hypothetical protein